MTDPNQLISVTIVGDVIVDRHFYHFDDGVVEVAELGGAAALDRLLQASFAARRALVGEPPRVTVKLGMETSDLAKFPPAGNAFAIWRPHKQSEKQGAPSVWRAALPMGYGAQGNPPTGELRLKRAEGVAARILVLDDGGFDFRQRASKTLWSLPAEGEAEPEWIILKMSRPVAHGDLWHELIENFADRLVCIVSANELRDEPIVLGKGASWEAAIEDISSALETNPVLKTLGACRHLVVNFSVNGALWIDRADASPTMVKLIFDPERAEGEWGGIRKGAAFGYLMCMAAAVAHAAAAQVAEGKSGLELGSPIRAGLSAMRDLLENGHGDVAGARPSGYPVARLGKLLAEAKGEFSIAPVVWPRPAATKGAWMMASDAPEAPEAARKSVILGLARQIVINGYGALRGVSHAQFGALVTADRAEIEALRGLRRLMRDYGARDKADKPLSIGVFGPPGAGKSFGVKQLAKEVFGDKAWLEFNLSQFEGARRFGRRFPSSSRQGAER